MFFPFGLLESFLKGKFMDSFPKRYLHSYTISFCGEVEFAESEETLRERAENGNASALFHWAYRFALTDWAQMVSLLERAAAQKYVPAMTSLAAIYWNGDGVPEDRETGFRLAEEAYALEPVNAAHSLGTMCLLPDNGSGRQDLERAYSLLLEGGEGGNLFARANLGYCFLKGIGTRKDPERAVELFRQTEVIGNSKFYLAYCALYGIGMKQDRKAAQKYAQDALELGWKEAFRVLLFLYPKGSQEQKEACAYVRKMALEGDEASAFIYGVWLFNRMRILSAVPWLWRGGWGARKVLFVRGSLALLGIIWCFWYFHLWSAE